MVRVSFYLSILLLCLPIAAQEKVKKTETISTIPKIISAKINNTEIKGIVVFTPSAANNDGTLTGNLVFNLAAEERTKIAQSLNKPEAEIPAALAATNLVAGFEKNTHCPDIRLGFAELELDLAGGKLQLDRFAPSFAEAETHLYRALCILTERTNKGITNKGVLHYINLLLKGEEDEEPKVPTPN